MAVVSNLNTSGDNLKHNTAYPANPYSLFLILILLINSFGGVNRIVKDIKNFLKKGGANMKTFSVSDNDIQLLKAIKPFMSGKSQTMLDLLITTINVFRPEQLDQKINYDALDNLLTMLWEIDKTKKPRQDNEEITDVKESEPDSYENSENVEKLLNIISQQQK